MTHTVFVYGTLQFGDVLAAVIGRRLEGRAATLAGYARYAVKQQPFPGIVPDPRSAVRGLVFSGIDPVALARIDAFEGELYRRETVRVSTDDGLELDAQAYVVRPRFRALLADHAWDEEIFDRRWRERYVRACRAERRG